MIGLSRSFVAVGRGPARPPGPRSVFLGPSWRPSFFRPPARVQTFVVCALACGGAGGGPSAPSPVAPVRPSRRSAGPTRAQSDPRVSRSVRFVYVLLTADFATTLTHVQTLDDATYS